MPEQVIKVNLDDVFRRKVAARRADMATPEFQQAEERNAEDFRRETERAERAARASTVDPWEAGLLAGQCGYPRVPPDDLDADVSDEWLDGYDAAGDNED